MKVLSSPLTTEVEKYLRCSALFQFSESLYKLMILIDIKLFFNIYTASLLRCSLAFKYILSTTLKKFTMRVFMYFLCFW